MKRIIGTVARELARQRWSATVLGVIMLSSCADNTTAMRSFTLPSQWKGASDASSSAKPQDLSRWWKRCNDPILNQLIQDALYNSPDIHAALAKIREYRARRGVEQSALFPMIAGNGLASHTSSRDHDSDRSSSDDRFGISVDASWQVDLFGRQQQTIRAASADLLQVQENFHAAQVILVADVATAYVNFRSAEAQLAVVQRSLITRTETLQLTQWREQAGTGTALDTQQARTIFEQAKSAIPGLQLQATQSRNLLALLAGQTPGFYDRSLVKSRAVPLLSAPRAMGIPADTLRQRPDVRASEAAVLAATARTMSAERERLPAFQLTGSLGAESGSGRAFFSPQTTLASLAGGLTAPIFQAGRIRNKILMQTEQQRQAFSAYEVTVLRALSEVENALAAVQRYQQQAQSIQSSITAAAEAQRLAALQYEAGQIDLFLSLDTQRTLLSLQQQQVSTMTQQATASIQLYKALGGGWSKN